MRVIKQTWRKWTQPPTFDRLTLTRHKWEDDTEKDLGERRWKELD
jgi:hypothetical protein